MARARNIKPGFFLNEYLGTCDPLEALLFEGLWLLADREGRLEFRPLRIKAQIFPYRDLSAQVITGYIRNLSSNGFIVLYEADGNQYIEVCGFLEHQNPHKNEKASDIPAPPEKSTACNKSSNYTTSTDNIGITPADSLNPDSLNPDSLNPEKTLTGNPVEPANASSCPHAEIVKLYHELLPELPSIRDLTPKRQAALRARWKSHKRFQDLSWWRDYFLTVKDSDFLMGRLPGKTWQADFDFLIRSEKFQKIIEGGYQNAA